MRSSRVRELIGELAAQEASRRRDAATELGEADERAVYPLINALGDENPGVQDAAMRSLTEIGGEVTAYMVLPLLRGDPFQRNTALIVLRDLGSVSAPFLYPLLHDKDEDVRKFSLDLLGEIREGVEPERLMPCFEDENANVRAAVANAVAALAYQGAVPRLLQALQDEEWVCFSALEALGRLRATVAVGAITGLLQSGSEAVRYATIETLGKIGSPESADALGLHISRTGGLERASAIKSLVQVGATPSGPGVSEALAEMLRGGEWDEKLVALDGLLGLKDASALVTVIDIAGSLDPSVPESEELLIRIMDSLRRFEDIGGSEDVLLDIVSGNGAGERKIKFRGRMIAARMLGEMKSLKAVPHLLRLMGDKSRDVRRACITALGTIGGAEARKALLLGVSDHDGHIRKTAVNALGRAGDDSVVEPLLDLLGAEPYRDVIEETVEALLDLNEDALTDQIDEFRATVREAVAKLSQNLDVLLPLAGDADPQVRLAAISGLGRSGDERASAELLRFMRDKTPEVRRAAVAAMGELGSHGEEIKSLLDDADMWVRLHAINALARTGCGDAMGTLASMLGDSDVPVVLSAIDAIACLGGADVVRLLRPLEGHHEEAVRDRAAQAMETLA